MTTALRRRRHQLMLGLLAAVAGLAAAMAAEPTKAAAHSDLTASSPTAGSSGAPPEAVVLTFSDEVEPTFARVTLAVDGAKPVTLPSKVTGSEVRATPTEIDRNDAQQEWKVAYRVVSGDGHPITGTLSFTVEPATNTQESATQEPADQGAGTPVPAPSPSPQGASASPTPTAAAAGSATPTSTVPPGFPAESDVHQGSSRTWPMFVIMCGLLLVVPAMAGLFRLLPNDPGGVITTQATPQDDDSTGPVAEEPVGDGATPDQPMGEDGTVHRAEPPSQT